MDHQTPTAASLRLRALAERNATVYAGFPQTRAIILTGSAAEGTSDYFSDLDIIIYHETLPGEEELLAAARQNKGLERKLIAPRSEEDCSESYLVDGVECQVGHTTIASWERDMAVVLEHLEVTSPIQKALGGLLAAKPLYGEALVDSWQRRIAVYPDALAEAMVSHYLNFFPLWSLQERFAVRDTTIWRYQALVEIAYHLLGVLSGLNRCYYSTFQLKRVRRLVARMKIAPVDFADRLESLFSSGLAFQAQQAKGLVEETVGLVEQHLPQINTSHIWRSLNWEPRSWQE